MSRPPFIREEDLTTLLVVIANNSFGSHREQEDETYSFSSFESRFFETPIYSRGKTNVMCIDLFTNNSKSMCL